MKKALKIALTVIAFSAFGFCGGLGIHDSLLQLFLDGAFTRWQALGSPPQAVAKLQGIDVLYGGEIAVIVETVSGQSYRCCTSAHHQWEEIESRSIYQSELDCAAPLPPRAPNPPGPIVACIEIVAFEWVTARTRFALLADGTVWTWYQHVDFMTSLYIVGCGLLGGCLVGLLISLGMNRRPRESL
jgi:hypothetical protein